VRSSVFPSRATVAPAPRSLSRLRSLGKAGFQHCCERGGMLATRKSRLSYLLSLVLSAEPTGYRLEGLAGYF
jgi:hypothetical protein